MSLRDAEPATRIQPVFRGFFPATASDLNFRSGASHFAGRRHGAKSSVLGARNKVLNEGMGGVDRFFEYAVGAWPINGSPRSSIVPYRVVINQLIIFGHRRCRLNRTITVCVAKVPRYFP